MGFVCRGEVWIPLDEWARFVLSFVSTGAAEVSLGPPSINGDDVVVPYAANTECHPSQEAVPPEWERKKTVENEYTFDEWFEEYIPPMILDDEGRRALREAFEAGRKSVKQRTL